ncbi:MAG: hypothetical protein K0R55_1206 [Sporomusa sp.]|jgi:hypothetical protein|nr:hypothetical protein [Sporomusa sp.]
MSRAITKDYEEIVEVINRYVKGVILGKSEVMKPSFHKDATMYGYVQGVGLSEGSIQNLYDVVDQAGPAPNLKARVDILDLEGTVASARVVLEAEQVVIYTDFHHLLKIDGEWKIISKIFHHHS